LQYQRLDFNHSFCGSIYGKITNLPPRDWIYRQPNGDRYTFFRGKVIRQENDSYIFKIRDEYETIIPKTETINPQMHDKIEGLWINRKFIEKSIDKIFSGHRIKKI